MAQDRWNRIEGRLKLSQILFFRRQYLEQRLHEPYLGVLNGPEYCGKIPPVLICQRFLFPDITAVVIPLSLTKQRRRQGLLKKAFFLSRKSESVSPEAYSTQR